MKSWFFIILLIASAIAQTPPTPAAASDIQQYVIREFGSEFKVLAQFEPLSGDFNNDGQEDVAVAVTVKSVLAKAVEKDYKVIDPYDSYFGFGDPKVTQDFVNSSSAAGPPRYVAIAHSWKTPTATAKFVVINLPFERLEIGATRLKKKKVDAIAAQDSTGITGIVYWNGRKYKYEPGGGM